MASIAGHDEYWSLEVARKDALSEVLELADFWNIIMFFLFFLYNCDLGHDVWTLS